MQGGREASIPGEGEHPPLVLGHSTCSAPPLTLSCRMSMFGSLTLAPPQCLMSPSLARPPAALASATSHRPAWTPSWPLGRGRDNAQPPWTRYPVQADPRPRQPHPSLPGRGSLVGEGARVHVAGPHPPAPRQEVGPKSPSPPAPRPLAPLPRPPALPPRPLEARWRH